MAPKTLKPKTDRTVVTGPTKVKERQPLPPATGVARWIGIDPVSDNWWIRINEVEYEVEPVDTGFLLWRLDKDFNLLCRHVRTGADWNCDCEDAVNRPERRNSCKHVRGLRAALTRKAL